MRIGKFRQVPQDRKRYVVNYADWLNDTEIVTSVTMKGNVPDDTFYVDGFVVNDDKEVIFYVSGGVAGTTYEVSIQIGTSMDQIKADTITFAIV